MKRYLLSLPALTLALAAGLGACNETDSGGPQVDAGVAGDTSTAGNGGAGAAGTAGASGTSAAGTAGVSGAGAAGTAGTGGATVTPVNVGTPLGAITSNPLVSRGKPAFASGGTASYINDGKYSNSGALTWQVQASAISAATPAWVAINVGTGPSKLLLTWNCGSNYAYSLNGTFGGAPLAAPDSYSIETSADFDGVSATSGSWQTATIQVADSSHVLQDASQVSGNDVRTRGHSFAYPADAKWVRFSVTKVTGVSTAVALDEIDIHDVSNGSQDTWLFFGDSITAFAYDRAPADQPSFAEAVHQKHAGYFPAIIDAGIGSEQSADGQARLQKLLDLNPDYHFIAINYGTNDSWGSGKDPTTFKATMQSMITTIKGAGRVPVLGRIPYSPDLANHSSIPAFNTAIDALTTSNSLSTEGDMYAFFANNPDALKTDFVHPNAKGCIGMNKVWADANDSAYSP